MIRDALKRRVAALIDRLADGSRDERARLKLLRAVSEMQARAIPTYGRLFESRKRLDENAIAAMPTDVFRHARIAVHPPSDDVRLFRTSGTTNGARGQHAFRDLGLYDRAATREARRMLFPDRDRMRLLIVAPPAKEATDSSLSYMLARFVDWFGTHSTYGYRDGTLAKEPVITALREAEAAREPIAILGTSFAFVHLEDALEGTNFRLPEGSRIMQTGGFKGRSREVDPDAMRAMLRARFGVPDPFIIAEYGMTELSSQMYETTLRDAAVGRRVGPRRFAVPGWMRAYPVDADTLQPVPRGDEGLLRLEDLANVDSCAVIQTADRAREVDDGFVLLGRAEGSVPRGCSLAIDEALGGAT